MGLVWELHAPFHRLLATTNSQIEKNIALTSDKNIVKGRQRMKMSAMLISMSKFKTVHGTKMQK